MRRRDENEIVDVLAHRRRYSQRLRRRDEKIPRARLGEFAENACVARNWCSQAVQSRSRILFGIGGLIEGER